MESSPPLCGHYISLILQLMMSMAGDVLQGLRGVYLYGKVTVNYHSHKATYQNGLSFPVVAGSELSSDRSAQWHQIWHRGTPRTPLGYDISPSNIREIMCQIQGPTKDLSTPVIEVLQRKKRKSKCDNILSASQESPYARCGQIVIVRKENWNCYCIWD